MKKRKKVLVIILPIIFILLISYVYIFTSFLSGQFLLNDKQKKDLEQSLTNYKLKDVDDYSPLPQASASSFDIFSYKKSNNKIIYKEKGKLSDLE